MTFFYFIYLHDKAKSKLRSTRCKITINKKYISRIKGDWVSFKDDGQEFVDKNNPYTSDLDIFGKKSLYQFINETNTYLGKCILRDFLDPSVKTKKDILEKQEAIKEISQLRDFCEDFKCQGMMSKGVSTDPQNLIEFLEGSGNLFKYKLVKYIFITMTISTITLFISLILNPTLVKVICLTGLILINLTINLLYYKRLSLVLNRVSQFEKSIHSFKSMITLIESFTFNSKLNKEMQNKLYGDMCSSDYIKKLGYISQAVNAKNNSLIYFIFTILLGDFHCVFALEKLRDRGGKNIKNWLEVIGYFEAIISLCVIPQIYEDWVYPEITDENLEVVATKLGHPLIKNHKRIYNDFQLKNIIIISGSNMSGKTTFLRTIGINLSLCYAGAPVCASSFSAPIVDIYTSMRIQDDLKENISTFQAELLRIKKIIDKVNSKNSIIFLIDEIFRGTNSYDRIYGARQVLLQLNKPWIIGGISTHDLELCSLEDSNKNFTNYYFVETYKNDKIKFDYKIKKGKSTTRNARYLMKIIGIELEN